MKGTEIPTSPQCNPGPFPVYPNPQVEACEDKICFGREAFEDLILWRDEVYQWYQTYKEVC